MQLKIRELKSEFLSLALSMFLKKKATSAAFHLKFILLTSAWVFLIVQHSWVAVSPCSFYQRLGSGATAIKSSIATCVSSTSSKDLYLASISSLWHFCVSRLSNNPFVLLNTVCL